MRKRIAALVVIIGCSNNPQIEWGDIVYSGAPQTPNEFPSLLQSAPSGTACPGSFRIAKTGTDKYAVWWESNRDSSVALMTSRSSDGRTWAAKIAADTTDHGVRGCGRPAPAIAADSARRKC